MIDIDDIHKICRKYYITNYIINSDGSIDVKDDVILYDMYLKEIPLKFNKVSGYFSCSDNNLKSLKNSPIYVGRSFYCDNNMLTSLEYSPDYVGGDFICNYNRFTSLDGLKVSYKKLYFDNKNKLIRKHKLKQFISI